MDEIMTESKKKKVFIVAGARPNFVKVAPIMRAMAASPSLRPILVHTGQHYDHNMSQSFFDELNIPRPDVFLEVGSGSHAAQTAAVMLAFEKAVLELKPDLVLVVGDVNSTLACSLVSAKLMIPVAHVEAGLRSFDRSMPEEINRVLTDSISSFLFITEPSGRDNLLREGVAEDNIFFVGNVMIDTLAENARRVRNGESARPLGDFSGDYAALTLHRPSNVDDPATFSRIISALEAAAAEAPVFFPAHPRTVNNIRRFGLDDHFAAWDGASTPAGKIFIMEPLGYLEFLSLTMNAKIVLTDSGGIQEETTWLGVPCATIRENTERPVTVDIGTNILVGSDAGKISAAAAAALRGDWKQGRIPELWDGHAAPRIVSKLESLLY
ncbi:MAG TPA: UDP-N-acetylglucosamine 2-epimerase (non-hydrolyzing) [bacterium]|nr:UDP-N-acetylglucosamine 2-epimerase (non-hydrolyzing) [bacterium]